MYWCNTNNESFQSVNWLSINLLVGALTVIHLGFALAHDQTSAGKCTPLVSWGPCLSVISCRMPIPESTSGILFFPELQVRGQRCLKYYMFHLGIRHKVQAVFFYMWHYIGCFLCMFCKTFRILIPCCLYLMLFLACHSSLCPLHLVLTLPVFLHALMNGLTYLVPFLLDPPPPVGNKNAVTVQVFSLFLSPFSPPTSHCLSSPFLCRCSGPTCQFAISQCTCTSSDVWSCKIISLSFVGTKKGRCPSKVSCCTAVKGPSPNLSQ